MRRHARISLAALAVALPGLPALAQLDPPPGPVQPTMKRLDEVEPRIAINQANTPGDADSLYRITEPGSYYLTGNAAGVTGKAGIEIAADRVTIDLMGHTLQGVSGSLSGVAAEPGRSGITVRNGLVRGWGADGIGLDLEIDTVEGGRVEGVRAVGNGGNGIAVGNGFVVGACSAVGNGDRGILVRQGCVIESSTAAGNAAWGIATYDNCVVRDCVSEANEGPGILVGDMTTVTHSVANGNGTYGIYTYAGGTVIDCVAAENEGVGIYADAGTQVRGCTTQNNFEHGITVVHGCLVVGNQCHDNGLYGFDGAGVLVTGANNCVRDNSVISNVYGVQVTGVSNLIIRNTARSSSEADYDVPVPANMMGPILSKYDIATNGNPHCNYQY